MTGPRSFRFLGVERSINSASDWNRVDWPKLWIYNLHYFDDLAADGAEHRREWQRDLLQRWIHENPPGKGGGWEPYPTSLRLVNWIKWSLCGNPLDEAVLASLAVQARWLRRRLEIHLLGNHLWANAKALVFVGAFFQGDESERWVAKGLALLRRELGEQILADGGHFERSPMYHAIALGDLLDLLQLSSIYRNLFAESDIILWRETALRMLCWLRVMTHPDGDIAFFNDAALGIAPPYAVLSQYAKANSLYAAEQPLNAVEALQQSGYVRLEKGAACLIADVGLIGPDYLPGHAHADTLSFELSLNGRRIIVNSGTSTYAPGVERLCQRGTAAHNTVQIDELDSSEVWSSFRVARRAQPFAVAWGDEGNGAWLTAAHDGYRRLPGRPVHRRRWHLAPDRLTVSDHIAGSCREAVAYYRLHPSVRVHEATATICSGYADADGMGFQWRLRGASACKVVASTWHPGFGLKENCDVVKCIVANRALELTMTWRAGAPQRLPARLRYP